MSTFYCGECERLRNVRKHGYEDVGGNLGVCEGCACEMQEKTAEELLEHWSITAPAPENTKEAREALIMELYRMPLVDLLTRHKNLQGEA